jgi:hypothetical protein
MDEEKPAVMSRPAGANLLGGSTTQIIEMLNELTYGERAPAALLEEKALWLEQRKLKHRIESE